MFLAKLNYHSGFREKITGIGSLTDISFVTNLNKSEFDFKMKLKLNQYDQRNCNDCD